MNISVSFFSNWYFSI